MHENTLRQAVTTPDDEVERQPLTVIEPLRDWLSLDVRELWEYRELLYFFLWRDIKVRYKQTVLGFVWVILQPLMPMIIFSVFFGLLVRVPSDNIPYPVFAYAALLPWQLFAYAFYASSQSLVNNQGLVTKVYFPRLLVPLSVILGGLIDFLIALPLLVGMIYYYGIALTWSALALPLFLLLTLLTALAKKHPRLSDLHNIRIRENDQGLFVHYHCRFAPSETIDEVHTTVDQIENSLLAKFPAIRRVIAHAEPIGRVRHSV